MDAIRLPAHWMFRVERATGPFSAATCRRAERTELFSAAIISCAHDSRAGRPTEQAGGLFHPEPVPSVRRNPFHFRGGIDE